MKKSYYSNNLSDQYKYETIAELLDMLDLDDDEEDDEVLYRYVIESDVPLDITFSIRE